MPDTVDCSDLVLDHITRPQVVVGKGQVFHCNCAAICVISTTVLNLDVITHAVTVSGLNINYILDDVSSTILSRWCPSKHSLALATRTTTLWWVGLHKDLTLLATPFNSIARVFRSHAEIVFDSGNQVLFRVCNLVGRREQYRLTLLSHFANFEFIITLVFGASNPVDLNRPLIRLLNKGRCIEFLSNLIHYWLCSGSLDIFAAA